MYSTISKRIKVLNNYSLGLENQTFGGRTPNLTEFNIIGLYFGHKTVRRYHRQKPCNKFEENRSERALERMYKYKYTKLGKK